MTILKNKTFYIVVLAIAVILLCFLLFNGKSYDKHTDDFTREKTSDAEFKKYQQAAENRYDSVNLIAQKNIHAFDSLQKIQAATKINLTASVNKAAQLAAEVKQYKRQLNKDSTDDYYTKCDSLANEVIVFKNLYETYLSKADSLENLNDSIQIQSETVKQELKRLYDELKSRYTMLKIDYENLKSDYTKMGKSLARQKFQKKLLAVVALLGLGAAALK